MRADFTIGRGTVKKDTINRLVPIFISENRDFIHQFCINAYNILLILLFPLTIYPADAKMRASAIFKY
jgi:hypothetical protein